MTGAETVYMYCRDSCHVPLVAVHGHHSRGNGHQAPILRLPRESYILLVDWERSLNLVLVDELELGMEPRTPQSMPSNVPVIGLMVKVEDELKTPSAGSCARQPQQLRQQLPQQLQPETCVQR